MTLAIDCRMIGSGGIGTYISSLIPHFLTKAHCLLIGSHEQIDTWQDNPNAALIPCAIKMFSMQEALFFPSSIAREINKCDAFYTPYCGIPRGIRVPVFATIHDVVFLDVKGLSSPLGTFARKQVYKYAVRRSRVLFTVSEFSAYRIRETLGVRHKNIAVAPDALPDWFGGFDGFDTHSRATRPPKKKQILFVGNIKRHKGLRSLLDAFTMAREKGLDAQLVIVGAQDGFRTSDNTVIADIPAVRFTGRISDEDLLSVYRESALLVQPSLYEGFGLPPLEALSLGTNALITDIPVFREIYDGFDVMFFHAGDSTDLCSKMLDYFSGDWQRSPSPPPARYSFAHSADIILNAIKAAAWFDTTTTPSTHQPMEDKKLCN